MYQELSDLYDSFFFFFNLSPGKFFSSLAAPHPESLPSPCASQKPCVYCVIPSPMGNCLKLGQLDSFPQEFRAGMLVGSAA